MKEIEFTVCKLKPKGPLHLGSREAGEEETEEYIHSDTLFSAICNCYRLLYGKKKLESMLQLFREYRFPFLISSAFPFIDETFLFPLPKNKNLKLLDEPDKFKKIEFVSDEIFKRVIKNEDISKFLNEDNLIQDKRVLMHYKSKKKKFIWSIHSEVPHAVLDRKTNVSNIFHFSEVRYTQGCGLFFLIDWKSQEYEDELKGTLNLLAHEGVGGDRTSGKGLFKRPEFDKISFQIEEKSSKYFVSLSLYYPLKAEIRSVKGGWYELIKRGGWIYSVESRTLRRKSIRMLLEGSVLPEIGNKGELKDVTPDILKTHKVYRYGIPFKIPVEVGDEV